MVFVHRGYSPAQLLLWSIRGLYIYIRVYICMCIYAGDRCSEMLFGNVCKQQGHAVKI